MASRQVYVLVHPEFSPELDPPTSIHPWIDEWDGFDHALYDMVDETAARAFRKVAIVDGSFVDMNASFSDNDTALLACDLPADGWNTVEVEPGDLVSGQAEWLSAVAGPYGIDHVHVLLAGFHRDDCVRRVAEVLRSRGVPVTFHEPCVLPLPDEGPAWSTWTKLMSAGSVDEYCQRLTPDTVR